MKAPVNLALLPIIEQAAAEGFTHVLTMAGPVPLEQFHYRDTLGYSYADGAIYGPWRAATTLETEAYKGPPLIGGIKARDTFICTKEIPS